MIVPYNIPSASNTVRRVGVWIMGISYCKTSSLLINARAVQPLSTSPFTITGFLCAGNNVV